MKEPVKGEGGGPSGKPSPTQPIPSPSHGGRAQCDPDSDQEYTSLREPVPHTRLLVA